MIPRRDAPGYSDYRPYNAYTARYPHLHSFGVLMSSNDPAIRQMANRRFCQAALRLAAPNGISALMVWDMAGVANGSVTTER